MSVSHKNVEYSNVSLPPQYVSSSPTPNRPNSPSRTLKQVRRRLFHGRRRRLILGLVTILVTFYIWNHLYFFRDTLYILRPLFDHENEFTKISHYRDSSMAPGELCAVHGWTKRLSRARVLDVVIFSLEFDLLELRMRELWDVVDLFVVIEADRTFSGEKKPLLLSANLHRFEWASKKLRHHAVVDVLQPLKRGESPFVNENLQRSEVTKIVDTYAENGDLVILADVDEIPRGSTVDLLRSCTNWPDPLHLQLKTFFYSFEFYFSDNDSWRAKIQTYHRSTFYYNHSQKSKFLLVDSGWHCTFCFRLVEDFRFKMLSYSHNDRLMGRKDLLEKAEIQRRICNGLDIFDMYPEVYTWREMFQKFGPIPKSHSFIDMPRTLVANRTKFPYLLPGNCVREDH